MLFCTAGKSFLQRLSFWEQPAGNSGLLRTRLCLVSVNFQTKKVLTWAEECSQIKWSKKKKSFNQMLLLILAKGQEAIHSNARRNPRLSFDSEKHIDLKQSKTKQL